MDQIGKITLGLMTLVVANAMLASVQKVSAAEQYECPYGDGLFFNTVKELQDHVKTAHPGRPLPIVINWQGI
jgi:hypothetical protein